MKLYQFYRSEMMQAIYFPFKKEQDSYWNDQYNYWCVMYDYNKPGKNLYYISVLGDPATPNPTVKASTINLDKFYEYIFSDKFKQDCEICKDEIVEGRKRMEQQQIEQKKIDDLMNSLQDN